MISPADAAGIVNRYLPEPEASLANGIMFGIPLRDHAFIMQIKQVGLIHLVVLSGMNITILAALIEALCSKFSRRISSVITILIVLFFTIFVGLQAPIIRATLTYTLTLVSIITGRVKMPLYLLFIAAVLSLLYKPEWIASISFQLSYGATVGLLLFRSPASPGKGITSYISEELRTSLAAQVFTVPIICYYFRQISLIGPVANILVSWTVAPIMILTAALAIAGSMSPPIATMVSYPLYGLTKAVTFVIAVLSRIPLASVSF